MGFKNPGSGFGGAHPPLLYPTVSNTTVDSITVIISSVSYTSPPASPLISHPNNCGFAPKIPFFTKFPFIFLCYIVFEI